MQVNIYNYYYHDTRTGYGYENKMSKTSVILYIEVRKNTSLVLILLLHLFIDKHLMMFCSAWKTCVTYSVSHNSIHHPKFSGNQGNHHNFVSILVAHKLWLIWIRDEAKKIYMVVRHKNAFFEFLALFWAYIRQPDNHIGWATLLPFALIYP